MSAVRITRAAAYRRVKGVIARDRGIDPGDFSGSNTLQGAGPKGLMFSAAGQRALAPLLVSRFSDVNLEFTRSQAGSATTVSILAALVWAAIPVSRREEG
ncbi:MAG: hypothetical protein HMLKMBBP_01254 [Planctomycetes bacterium]|nr:hypothetical protein [Planctomycetota bacterium]